MPFEAILFNPEAKESSRVSVRVFGSSLEVTGGPKTLRVDPAKCELSAGGWDNGSLQIAWPGMGGTWALSSKDPGARVELARIPQFGPALLETSRLQKKAKRRGGLGLTLVPPSP